MAERVLVIEDNQALAENIAELLQDEGMAVTLCPGAHALPRAAEGGFDLAIVDIGLAGGESGLELVPRLRRLSPLSETVLMTGNATLHSALEAIRSGVYAYLPKPFDPEELVAVAKRALAQVALKRERQALAQRLAESEALHRGVVETVEQCIVGLEANGDIRFANRFTYEMFGGDELEGCSLLSLFDARSRKAFAQAIERASRGAIERDLETRHGSERIRTLRWTLTPLHAESVEVAQRARSDASRPPVLAVGLDITERLELEQRNAEGQAMALMGTLATSLAHEIRNPLNAAKLQLELVVRRARKAGDSALAEQLETPAKLVRTEIERLGLLLDEFLHLARPRLPVRKVCSVAELLGSVVALEDPAATRAGVQLTIALEEPNLTVRADADKLKQVLINLMRNGIDALAGREDGQILLRARALANGGVELSVEDNGPGLAPEVIGTVFKPFVTTKPAGTGLGLAIVQKIVAQHDGTIELVPREGGGTIAKFSVSA